MPTELKAKVKDCGDGYGVAAIQDEEGQKRTVAVDANAKDGTVEPRIQVDGAWKSVDAAFGDSFRAASADERFKNLNFKCPDVEKKTENSGLRLRTKIITGSLFALGAGGSYAINKIALGPLDIASTNPGNVGLGLNAANAATDALATVTYVAVEPQLSSGEALVLDGTVSAVAAGFLLAGLSTDRSGDSEIRTGLSLGSDVLAARAHRHLGRKWGSLIEVAAGAGLIAGGAWLGNKSTAVSEEDPGSYEDPGMAGARDLDVSSPKFLNRGSTMVGIGAAHVLTGLIFGARAVFQNDSSSAPAVSVSPKGGGAVVSWSGTF